MALPLSNSSHPSTDEALSIPVGYVQWLFLYQTLPTHPQMKLSPFLLDYVQWHSNQQEWRELIVSIKLFLPIHRRSSLQSCRLCAMALPLSNSSHPSTDEALSIPAGYVQWLFLYQTLPTHPQTKLSPFLPVMCNGFFLYQTLPTHPQMKLSPFLLVMCNGSSSIKLFPPIHR